jgi:hypothetical protein
MLAGTHLIETIFAAVRHVDDVDDDGLQSAGGDSSATLAVRWRALKSSLPDVKQV